MHPSASSVGRKECPPPVVFTSHPQERARELENNSASEAIRYFMGEGKYSDRENFKFPSFILTDLRMQGQDGFAVLQHLKENPEWKVIPTVVLTSSADPDDIKKVYMLGASSFHQKPGDYGSLRRLLKILHDYWMTCFIPEVDSAGRQRLTSSKGQLGERFPQSPDAVQKRHKKGEKGVNP